MGVGGCEGGKLSHLLVRSATGYSQEKKTKHSPPPKCVTILIGSILAFEAVH